MRRPSARKRAPPAPRSAARAPTASSTAELHHLGSRIEIYHAKKNLWYGADVLEVKSVRGQYSRLRARYATAAGARPPRACGSLPTPPSCGARRPTRTASSGCLLGAIRLVYDPDHNLGTVRTGYSRDGDGDNPSYLLLEMALATSILAETLARAR